MTTIHEYDVKATLGSDSNRDDIWAIRRREAQAVDIMADAAGLIKLAEKLKECALWLEFERHADRDTGELKYKLKKMQGCRKRHCPICTWRKSLMWKAKLLNLIPTLLNEHKNYRFLLLTLTVPNCDISDLRETIVNMNSGWKRLIELKEFEIIKGFIRAIEVTQSKSQGGNAHPHYHVLLLVPPSYFSKYYIKQSRWLEMWQECMRDNSITQVDIRPVKDTKDAAAEVLKYAVKAGDLIGKGENHEPSVLWFKSYVEQVHKLHFISTGGLLKDAIKDTDIKKDLVNVNEHPEDNLENKSHDKRFYSYERSSKNYYRARK